MHTKARSHSSIFAMSWSPASAALAIILTLLILIFLILLVMTLTAQPAQGQTFTVLHNFTGGEDGAGPNGITRDAAGNLYGTTAAGGYFANYCGNDGCGTVFKLTPTHGAWTVSVLHMFTGPPDGASPGAGVVFGPDGQLYGTTTAGGYSIGTTFSLRSPATACETALCNWTETVLSDRCGVMILGNGDVAFDQQGNVYTTSCYGGQYDEGNINELIRGDGWSCRDVHDFLGEANVYAGLVLDSAGNMYGTSSTGGQYSWGTVFVVNPAGDLSVLYAFQGGADGGTPLVGLTLDAAGHLYGTARAGGSGGTGTVFMLTPGSGGWVFSVLYSFTDGGSPCGTLAVDSSGNLYGTDIRGGAYGKGAAFKLAHGAGGWTYNSLHDFSGGDGSGPAGNVALDASGNLYGTAGGGGAYGYGVVFEIKP